MTAVRPAAIPTTHRCLVQSGDGGIQLQPGFPVAPLEDDMLLVKTAYVALNPNDYKMVDNFPTAGLAVGCDYAGVVVAKGAKVTAHIDVGDRVCGSVHGSNPLRPRVGAFGEYVTAFADGVLKLPESMPWPNAAAIGGVAPATLGLAFCETLNIPGHIDKPASDPFFVLVWGGSTANGTLAIQLLKLSGARVVATGSPKNFDFVKGYGADEVFDYNSPTCAEDIKAYTKNTLRYALDIIGTASSMSKCYSAIGRAGGRYTSLERFDQEMATKLRRAVKADFALGLSMTGERMEMGGGYGAEAMPQRRELAVRWFASLQKQLDAGNIRSHPPRELDGGLDGVMAGLDELRRGAVSGQKLVCSVS